MTLDLFHGITSSEEHSGRFYGVTIGVVTNNSDQEGLGRVKVSFPWLSDEHESQWARVLTPMAGDNRGLYFLPEVGDEVLVAFEHGMIDFPYVLGALWNGKEPPIGSNSDGKNNLRLIKSRSGHTIIFDDSKDAEKIIIRDKTEKNEIVIDSKTNTVTVRAEGDLTIESKGKLAITSSNDDLSISCKNLSIQTQQNCEINAQQNLKVKAASGMGLNCAAGVKINDGALEVV